MNRATLKFAVLLIPVLALGVWLLAQSRPRTAQPGLAAKPKPTGPTEKVVFAGGCFWCMEPPFEKLDGVFAVVSGYTGGSRENATYQRVCDGRTRHLEAIEVEYDPQLITYERLLEVFWRNIDPTDSDGQFCDRGLQYLSAVFYQNERQRDLAEASKKKLQDKFKQPIATQILPAVPFYTAEAYHQDYYLTNSKRYKRYRKGCGRDHRLRTLWGEKPEQQQSPKND